MISLRVNLFWPNSIAYEQIPSKVTEAGFRGTPATISTHFNIVRHECRWRVSVGEIHVGFSLNAHSFIGNDILCRSQDKQFILFELVHMYVCALQVNAWL